MATNSEPVTPETTMDRLKEIGERDSAARTEQPSPDANSAASVVSPAADAAPAATPPAQSDAPPAATDEWWNGADVSHAMLRTATSAEVERMFRAAQKKIREQGAEINRRSATPPAVTQPPAATPDAAASVDPRREEYKAVFYTNPERAAEIVQEWAVEASERRENERREHDTAQQRVAATISAARAGMSTIATDYGITDTTTLEFRIRTAVLPELNRYATERVFVDYGGESGDPQQVAQAEEARRLFMQDPQNYRLAYAHIFGEPTTAAPQQTIAVPAVPHRATPPHSMAVAPPNAPRKIDTTKKLPPDMDRSLSKLGGLSEEGLKRFKDRVAASA